MRNKWSDTFGKYIDVNIPIIYICDFDFARVDHLILGKIGDKKITEWNPATGTTDFRTKHQIGMGKEQSLESLLDEKYNCEIDKGEVISREQYVVLREIQDFIDEPAIKTYLQLIAQRRLYDREYNTTLIISSSVRKIPEEITRYVSFIDDSFPNEVEISQLIDEHIEENQYDKEKFKDEDREAIMPSLKGLSPFEIDRMLDMAMSSNGTLSKEDNEMILRQKKSMVKSSGVLELIDSPAKIEDIGGYDVLKKYLKDKSKIYNNFPKAVSFGVSVPKGVFLVGMPGCGKSLAAKAAATLFNAPLLKMDMGSMMGKYVGESEANLRKAILIAEAVAPCVLWIDEIEKAFSGVNGNNDIMTRMFGYFLSWMQDKQSAVYVIATANNANNLPPELKRKGRFDEIFCINLPNEEECKSIFEVQIGKKKGKKCKIDSIDYSSLAKRTKGFNGADIESVVNEAVERCFLKDESKITTKVILDVINDTKSISMSCEEDIKKMDDIFKKSNFRNASTESSKK